MNGTQTIEQLEFETKQSNIMTNANKESKSLNI